MKLIHVDAVCLRVVVPGRAFGNLRRRVRASFHFSGIDYSLWVTDSAIEATYLAHNEGLYTLGECYLNISLEHPFNGYCYKLVTGIMGKAASARKSTRSFQVRVPYKDRSGQRFPDATDALLPVHHPEAR